MRQESIRKAQALLGNGWGKLLWKEFEKPYISKINAYVKQRRESPAKVFPDGDQIFRALKLCQPQDTKVVIIGQDPYPHCAADGLAFSASGAKDVPKSLENIFAELEEDIGPDLPHPKKDLQRWAEQGVLLLNTYLTTEKGNPGAHHHLPWPRFTRKIIGYLGRPRAEPRVFMLWGNHAQTFLTGEKPAIDPFSTTCLRASHPSPRSANRSFFGCRHFSKANAALEEEGHETIEWHASLNDLESQQAVA